MIFSGIRIRKTRQIWLAAALAILAVPGCGCADACHYDPHSAGGACCVPSGLALGSVETT